MYVVHTAGDVAGKYKIIGEVGRGADSIVYSARDANDTSAPIIAMKTFTDDNKYAYSSELRFIKNTAIYIDDFSSNSAHYIVIKYLQMDLQKFRACIYISEITPAIKSYLVKSIIKKIFLRLAEIHARGYIHGDISLKNIMIDIGPRDLSLLENINLDTGGDIITRAKQLIDNINLYIIDFGCSSAVTDLKKSKQIGTPGYVAPEVIFYQDYGRGIDIFSATIAAAELILGDYLFDVFYLYGYSAPDTLNKSYVEKMEAAQENITEDESEGFCSDIEIDEIAPTVKPKLSSARMQDIYTYYKNIRADIANNNADMLKKIFLTDGIFDAEIDYDMSINSDYHKIYMQLYIIEKFYISIMDYSTYHGFEGYYYNINRKLKFHPKCDKYTMDDLFDIMGYGHGDIVARANIKKFISMGAHVQPTMRPTAAAMAVYIDKLLV